MMDSYTVMYICLGAVVLVVATISIYLSHIRPFFSEIRYIKMELNRSIDEHEYLYWEKKLKRRYLSLIPFRRFFVKNKKKKKE